MQSDRFESLKQTHRFAEWRGKSEFAVPLRGFVLRGDEFPGWHVARAGRPSATAPTRTTVLYARGPEELLRIDLVESDSVGAAHDELLRALGEFQSPSLERQPAPVAGDVAFVVGTSVVFARGNLLILVRNGGRKIVETSDPAKQLDARIVEQLRALKR